VQKLLLLLQKQSLDLSQKSYVLKQHFFMFSQSRVPFAVVGSNTVMEVGGRKVRGRQYPWGIAEGLERQSF